VIIALQSLRLARLRALGLAQSAPNAVWFSLALRHRFSVAIAR
jgi:hypothetical protein